MQTSNISFTSKINLTTKYRFDQAAENIKNVVRFPWTAREIIKADKAYTRGICCCSAGGVITNGQDVTMFHIEPDTANLKDWNNIVRTLDDKIGQGNKKIQGFLFGGFLEEKSMKLFKNFKEFMEKNNIPYTKFEKQKSIYANSDILYNSAKDEWIITSDKISEKIKAQSEQLKQMPKEELQKNLMKLVQEEFAEKIELSPLDELSFIPAGYY